MIKPAQMRGSYTGNPSIELWRAHHHHR